MKVTMRQLRRLRLDELVDGVEIVDRKGEVKFRLEENVLTKYPSGKPIAGSEPPRKWIADVVSGEVRRATWEDQPGFWKQLN